MDQTSSTILKYLFIYTLFIFIKISNILIDQPNHWKNPLDPQSTTD